MKTSRLSTYLVVPILFVVLVAVVGVFVPLERSVIQKCPYCRARLEDRWVLGIHVTHKLDEGHFCSFYRNEVDPGHVHKWNGCVSSQTFTHEMRLGDSHSSVVGYFDSDVLFSILRSFPTRAERKAFISKYCVPQSGNDALCERVYKAQEPLRQAHKADPLRKDWGADSEAAEAVAVALNLGSFEI